LEGGGGRGAEAKLSSSDNMVLSALSKLFPVREIISSHIISVPFSRSLSLSREGFLEGFPEGFPERI
jgi:hypothetical protein